MAKHSRDEQHTIVHLVRHMPGHAQLVERLINKGGQTLPTQADGVPSLMTSY